jgi:hypothetical protein
MTAALTPVIATAYATDSTEEQAGSLDVIPGVDGSGSQAILTRPIISEETTSEADQILGENGWQPINVTPVGVLRQPGVWTNAGEGYIATVVPEGTDTRCDVCGRSTRWVVTDDREVVCACSLDEM